MLRPMETMPRPDDVLTVAEVSRQVRNLLESAFPRVKVEGEVTGHKRAASGHSYFALTERDADGTTAKLECVIYRFARAAAAVDLRDGQRIIASGRLTAYAGTSRYQLSVDAVQDAGLGDLLRRLDELRRRLAAEGLFDAERKRPLPFLPRRIGVVTSLRGAAVRDIVRTVHSRFPARILVADAVVQGDGAAERIAAGIDLLNLVPDVDVIIVGRGGGSLEDLWAFNEEVLVRAVAASRVPVVSAVGHEVDRVLTDEAADVRAPTPTAAGALVVPSLDELDGGLADLGDRLAAGLLRRLESSGQRLDDLEARLRVAGRRAMEGPRHRVDLLGARLASAHPARRLAEESRRVDALRTRLDTVGRRLLDPHRSALESARLRLEPLSPLAPLARGYALVRSAEGRLVRRHGDVAKGDVLDVWLGEGALKAKVTGSRPER
jgi:exodeoxyribonuclease VII large subunit